MKNFATLSSELIGETAMDSDNIKLLRTLTAALFIICGLTVTLLAQSDDEDAPPPIPKEQIKKAMEVMNTAKKIGPWENQYQVLEEATDNIFAQQGWDSEQDQFARQVMREVGRVAPWDPQKRQEVFVQQIQGRLNLTHDQAKEFDTSFQRAGMQLAMKHFANVIPVVLEVAKTRSMNEPFTAEQVQRWTKQLKPVLDDSMDSLEQVTDKLGHSLTPEQRRIMEGDLKAFRHRHEDMKRMADKWAAGQWSPKDWGLQSDPIHAAEMAKYAADDAEKNELVQRALNRRPDEQQIARDESEWDKYVKWFCNTYHCDDRQRTTADGILRGAKKPAISYMNAHRDRIDEARKRVQLAADTEAKKQASTELDKTLGPVIYEFERLKKRLYEEVITTDQRNKYTPAAKPVKAEKKIGD